MAMEISCVRLVPVHDVDECGKASCSYFFANASEVFVQITPPRATAVLRRDENGQCEFALGVSRLPK